MRNLIVFISICSIAVLSIFIGIKINPVSSKINAKKKSSVSCIPSIGKIEVLNGCGLPGAAASVADFLRDKGFDVKNIGNAEGWNYPFTIVISRIKDTTIAEKISLALNTDKLIIMRTDEKLYNVSVIIGSDFGELIK